MVVYSISICIYVGQTRFFKVTFSGLKCLDIGNQKVTLKKLEKASDFLNTAPE